MERIEQVGKQPRHCQRRNDQPGQWLSWARQFHADGDQEDDADQGRKDEQSRAIGVIVCRVLADLRCARFEEHRP